MFKIKREKLFETFCKQKVFYLVAKYLLFIVSYTLSEITICFITTIYELH